MDPGMWGAVGTVTAFVAFVAVVVWAYGRGRKADFDAAAKLPLEDDARREASGGERR